jgi:hypothetical protein
MRKGGVSGITLTAAIAAVLVFFSLGACDLLTNKLEIDVEKAMDEAVAYANAALLTVEVYYPRYGGQGIGNAEHYRCGNPYPLVRGQAARYPDQPPAYQFRHFLQPGAADKAVVCHPA